MKTTLVIFLVLFNTLMTPVISSAQGINLGDSLALVDFYDSTNGSNWNSNSYWKTISPVSWWHGVGVTGNRVTSIYMNGNNITGKFPSSLGNLDSLKTLYLIDNKISGNIPSSFGGLSALERIDLGANYLTGNIPSSLGNLVNLEEMQLYLNALTGTVPLSFGNLKKLQFTDFSYNKLSGDIAGALGSLNLSSLQIQENRYTFYGIEQLAQIYKANNNNGFSYSPQANLVINQQNDYLSVSVNGTPAKNTYKWFKVGTGLIATIVADSTFKPTSAGNYYVEVSNSVATQLTLKSDTVAAKSVFVILCPSTASFSISSNLSGPDYQWYRSTDGITFYTLFNNTYHTGAANQTLNLINIPSSWYGYKYFCVSNANGSILYTLIFSNNLSAIGNTSWENPANWSCGNLPDQNTDVSIKSGTIVLATDADVRSLKLSPGVLFTVSPGNTLTIKHE